MADILPSTLCTDDAGTVIAVFTATDASATAKNPTATRYS